MLKLAVAGAAGRMGSRVLACAAEDTGVRGAAALAHADDQLDEDFDVLIDFSTPAGTQQWLAQCVARGRAIVIGTTGHAPDQRARFDSAAQHIPVLVAANFSVGVNVLLSWIGRLAVALGDEYDIEIVESHHRAKVDAPSGTALALLEAITRATGRDPSRDVAYGRRGATGSRPPRQIGVHSLRLGDEVGCHTIHCSTTGESLSVTHRASSRDAFAHGAIRAAKWVNGIKSGLYSMLDVLEPA